MLENHRILIVEDEYFLADDLARAISAAGGVVVGPIGSIEGALQVAQSADLDGAVLDVNLRGEMVFSVADALLTRRVPFIFATGYDHTSIPSAYDHIPQCTKPCDAEMMLDCLGVLVRRKRREAWPTAVAAERSLGELASHAAALRPSDSRPN